MNEIKEELLEDVNRSWLDVYGDNKDEEGLAEEELKGKLDEIKIFLEEDFGNVPFELRKRIENITSLEKASKALRWAPRVASLEEFSYRLDELEIK